MLTWCLFRAWRVRSCTQHSTVLAQRGTVWCTLNTTERYICWLSVVVETCGALIYSDHFNFYFSDVLFKFFIYAPPGTGQVWNVTALEVFHDGAGAIPSPSWTRRRWIPVVWPVHGLGCCRVLQLLVTAVHQRVERNGFATFFMGCNLEPALSWLRYRHSAETDWSFVDSWPRWFHTDLLTFGCRLWLKQAFCHQSKVQAGCLGRIK